MDWLFLAVYVAVNLFIGFGLPWLLTRLDVEPLTANQHVRVPEVKSNTSTVDADEMIQREAGYF